ncbi:MAG: hypothetical protein WBQ03_05075 [Candidatus Sulfotelmatobacter sp.]
MNFRDIVIALLGLRRVKNLQMKQSASDAFSSPPSSMPGRFHCCVEQILSLALFAL